MTGKLNIKCNDFQENTSATFGSLREDKDFADVTLACEDGQQVETHRVILAASSPFFQNLLRRNNHPHPLIYMRGVESEVLLAIVDFLYCGEANVYQDNLDPFLAVAEELNLKELTTGQTEEVHDKTESSHTDQTHLQMNSKTFYNSEKSNLKTEQRQSNSKPISNEQPPDEQMNTERRIAIPNFVSGDLQELDEKVKSMMERSQNLILNNGGSRARAKICKVCGKEGAGIAIRDHIEANHLEGVCLPCNTCGKEFRSRMILRKHKCNCKLKDILSMGHQTLFNICIFRSRSQLRKQPSFYQKRCKHMFPYSQHIFSRTRASLRHHRASQHKSPV